MAVGSDEEILDLRGPETQVIDLGGRALLPGFVDTHSHLFNNAGQMGLTLEEAQTVGLRGGTTSLANMFVVPGFLQVIQDSEQHGGLKIRTSLYLRYNWQCDTYGDWYLEHPAIRDPETDASHPRGKDIRGLQMRWAR